MLLTIVMDKKTWTMYSLLNKVRKIKFTFTFEQATFFYMLILTGALAMLASSLRIPSLKLFAATCAALQLSTTRAMASESVENPDYKTATSIYDFTALDIKGNAVKLDKYKGHVAIIVNVASQCGLTANNYKQLVELHAEYGETKGLKILAFPCNQFNGQEPGNPEEIVCFAAERNVKFDMFDKVDVNGKNAHPLWNYLKEKQGGTLGSFIKWNFTKFIIDKNGQPVERHGPQTDPKDLVKSLEKYW